MAETRGCTFPDCDRKYSAKGWCAYHYDQVKKGRTLRPYRDWYSDPIKRFWKNVNKTDGCWLWLGAKSPDGYGRFFADGRRIRAHRYVYQLLVGPVPEGLTLDHLCRTPACVNPDHLEPVTDRENILRGFNPAAQNARKTHCLRGHEYSPSNTYRYGRRRRCLACERSYWKKLKGVTNA